MDFDACLLLSAHVLSKYGVSNKKKEETIEKGHELDEIAITVDLYSEVEMSSVVSNLLLQKDFLQSDEIFGFGTRQELESVVGFNHIYKNSWMFLILSVNFFLQQPGH